MENQDIFDPPGGQGYVKAGFIGFGGSGKTYTATTLALGIRNYFGLKEPIGFVDSENGAGFIRPRVLKTTNQEPLIKKTRSFSDLMAVAEVVGQRCSVLIVDSLTHFWRDLEKAYLKKINENRPADRQKHNLEFQDWNPIKATWSEWTDWFLNSPCHIVVCGRAGWEYEHEVNERTGKKELVKVGTKMKVEAEFAYEPGLMVEMESVEQDGQMFNLATIRKDRWDLLNGAQCKNPTFDFFKPHVEMYVPSAHSTIDMSVKSDVKVEAGGLDPWRKELRDRTILCEEITAELLQLFPSQAAEDKRKKSDKIAEVFGTRSWTAVENMRSDKLRAGLEQLKAESKKEAA